ncbi:hypothetical protein FNH09_39790 [Streptomyces adustus]|uniref:DUF4145 domain-containing protein n=1 Tax=Streptomyces adustus TaxID=1609272 RepID=A0A5N8VQT2_9ACTN|nr:hypothetical protein [Streptomyces adustus]MPY37142.1 hypothetical protein [Streptomyces adustus]
MNDTFSFETFFEGAKKAAHRAMDDHGRADYDEFALHAGVAVEKLAKAVLCNLNPLYIAGGKVTLSSTKKPKIYTITASEAVTRLVSLDILKNDSALRLLLDQRNGTVHASSGDEAKTQIPTLAVNIRAMLKHLEIPDNKFWERWTSTVDIAIDRQRSEIERDVQLRIEQARHRLDDRLEGLPLPKKVRTPRESSFTFFFADVNSDVDQDVISVTGNAGCPACRRTAIVKAAPDLTSPEAPMAAVALSCTWCQLQLEGAEEIRASGVDLSDAMEVASRVIYGGDPDDVEAS